MGHPDRLRPPHRGLPSLRLRRPPGDDALPPAVPVRVDLGTARRARARSGSASTLGSGCGRATCCSSSSSGTAIVRFVLETLRADNWTFFGVPTAQIVSLLFIVPALADPALAASAGPSARRPADASRAGDVGRHRTPGRADGADDDEATTSDDDDEDDDDEDDDEPTTRPTTATTRARTTATTPTEPASDDRPSRVRRAAAPGPTPGRPTPDMTAPPGSRPRRPPPGRVAPEALAAARGGAVEGLAWLGRPPEAKASLLYRLLRLVARFVLFVVFRFRIRTSGQEHLPTGGYFLVAAAHRGWMDPFVVMHAIPAEPRAWFLGSAPSTFTSRWRERLIHRLGGLLPVWRGGVGIDQHVELGARGHRQRRRLRPDARGHRQRAARPDRPVPDRLGGHRPAHRRADRAARDRRHRGAVPRPADGVAGPAGHLGPGPGRAGTRRAAARRRARARSSTSPAG